jgi:hypothetical protein
LNRHPAGRIFPFYWLSETTYYPSRLNMIVLCAYNIDILTFDLQYELHSYILKIFNDLIYAQMKKCNHERPGLPIFLLADFKLNRGFCSVRRKRN